MRVQSSPFCPYQLLEIPDLRILVVDDASPDGTGTLADQLARQSNGRVSVMHRVGPRGLGRAYLDGIRQALETDADIICQMDADLSHQPAQLIAMLDAAQNFDLVIGSRYVPHGQVVNWPLRRRLLSAGANAYIRLIGSLNYAVHQDLHRWLDSGAALTLNACAQPNHLTQ